MVDYTPERDASLGLVFRLNNLWAQADYMALSGTYKKWNNVLDRIYCNLLYKENLEIEEDNGKIIGITLNKKDTKIYSFLSKQIQIAEYNFRRVPRAKKNRARSIWYHSIQKKDIWLRKLMQDLKLYLKENKHTPGSAMFGTFGKGKK